MGEKRTCHSYTVRPEARVVIVVTGLGLRVSEMFTSKASDPGVSMILRTRASSSPTP